MEHRLKIFNAYLAFSLCSVRCTLLSAPRQNRLPPEGSTYPSTVTLGQEDGTLNVSPTCVSNSKYATEHQYSGAGCVDSKPVKATSEPSCAALWPPENQIKIEPP